jgi:hypothetical protein
MRSNTGTGITLRLGGIYATYAGDGGIHVKPEFAH